MLTDKVWFSNLSCRYFKIGHFVGNHYFRGAQCFQLSVQRRNRFRYFQIVRFKKSKSRHVWAFPF